MIHRPFPPAGKALGHQLAKQLGVGRSALKFVAAHTAAHPVFPLVPVVERGQTQLTALRWSARAVRPGQLLPAQGAHTVLAPLQDPGAKGALGRVEQVQQHLERLHFPRASGSGSMGPFFFSNSTTHWFIR